MKFLNGNLAQLKDYFSFFLINEVRNKEYLDLAFSYVTKSPPKIVLDKDIFENEIMAIRVELWGISLWQYLSEILNSKEWPESIWKESL
jgi:hypothetical protein